MLQNSDLSPVDQLKEIAALLARGVRKSVSQNPLNSPPAGLDVPAESRLTVTNETSRPGGGTPSRP